MLKRTFLIAVLALAACSQATQSTSAADDPAAIVRPIYARYMPGAPEMQYPNLEDQAPWSASLRQAMVDQEARFAQVKDADPEGLDFDPFISAQDWQLSDLNVTTESVVPQSHAVVRASFTNAGSHTEVAYDMVWENNGWRIDNMRSGSPGAPDAWDLRQLVTR